MSWPSFLCAIFLTFFMNNGNMVKSTKWTRPSEPVKTTESTKSTESIAEPLNRIHGGTNVESITDFKYMAYVKTIRDSYVCGAAIISRTHVLTSASCIEIYLKPPFLHERIVTGTNNLIGGGEEHMILFSTVHPQFYEQYPKAIRHDYGVVTLCAPIIFGRTQGPINLPRGEVQDGQEAVVTGWGNKENNRKSFILQKLVTKVYTARTCTRMDGSSPFNDTVRVCTLSEKGKGFCEYDNGSPLVANGEIIGIASLRHECASGRKDMYAYVYQGLNFIKGEIDEDICR